MTGRPRAGEEAQGTVDEEHRQPVHRGPSQEPRARTALAGQDSRLDEVVQGGAQKLEGGQASLPGSRRAGGAPHRFSDAENAVRNRPASSWANRG